MYLKIWYVTVNVKVTTEIPYANRKSTSTGSFFLPFNVGSVPSQDISCLYWPSEETRWIIKCISLIWTAEREVVSVLSWHLTTLFTLLKYTLFTGTAQASLSLHNSSYISWSCLCLYKGLKQYFRTLTLMGVALKRPGTIMSRWWWCILSIHLVIAFFWHL